MIIVDYRMRKIEKEKLKKMGYKLFEINYNNNLYYEISSHVDIHCCKIDKFIITSPNINYPNSIIGNTVLKSNYPFDIAYNVCIINKYAIHNFNYTDSKIIELLENLNYKKIHINQGYSKCSIAVIDENSAIVTDSKIANILSEKRY